MPYGNLIRIQRMALPEATMLKLLDDDNDGEWSEAVQERANEIMEAVDDEINVLLQGLYGVPFTDGNIPSLIEQIADKRIAYEMWQRRTDDLPENVNNANKRADAQLKLILNRKVQLFADDAPKKSQPPLVSKTDDDRVFSSSVIGKMPT